MNSSLNFDFKCPDCQMRFDIRMSAIAFGPKLQKGKRLSLVFTLCPQCMGELSKLSDDVKIKRATRIIRNVLKDKNHLEYTVTTDLAIMAHQGSHVDAILFGIDIPRFIFDAYNDGLIDQILYLPGGWFHDGT